MVEIIRVNVVEPNIADVYLEIHDSILLQVVEIFRDFAINVLPIPV